MPDEFVNPYAERAAEDAKRIAAGGQPAPWEETYEHPLHGPLTFRAEKMPTAIQLMQHRVAIDNLLGELAAAPSAGTQLLSAAIAGLEQLVELPVVKRETQVVDEDSGLTREQLTYYNPRGEINHEWLLPIWTAYSLWRGAVLDQVEALKKSLAVTATPPSGSSEPSTATTTSPQETAA